ncbi:NAD+ synthase [Natronospora cellulosivora (SeqCode)]
MKITLAQINPIIGDIKGNLKKIKKAIQESKIEEGDLIVFPELSLTGYPPRDLLYKKDFISETKVAIQELIGFSRECDEGILIGAPRETNKDTGKGLHNSALLIYKGELLFQQDKTLLPTYDVFDEDRYFDPADEINIVEFKGEQLGVTICEDIWNDEELWQDRKYNLDPVEILVNKGATIIVNLSASPFHIGKDVIRYKVLDNYYNRFKVPLVYVNQVGANDELIFDGKSLLLNREGEVVACLDAFEEDIKTIDLNKDNDIIQRDDLIYEEVESLHDALVMGIRDYFYKTGFEKALVSLSGGIDSVLTTCLAVEALGAENVFTVTMPGPYSSEGSVNDSLQLAENLGIDCIVVPINDIYDSYFATLGEEFKDVEMDVTGENIQARIRGNIIMAYSNRLEQLVLSAGNKSELAVGYCTMYGDMSGGLSVLADVYKTMVYEIAGYINKDKIIIPENVIKKAPSAELSPNQKDEDSLPPYEVLDQILYSYIDMNMSLNEIVEKGYDEEMVFWVLQRVNNNEYKRRQAAPGLKVSSKAFGLGRKMPIAARLES